MKTLDLHEEFLKVLCNKLSKKDVVNVVAEILNLEKDAAYRRINGRVNFSAREIGVICNTLSISLDSLMAKNDRLTWLPFSLDQPLKSRSVDEVFDWVDLCIERASRCHLQPAERGNVYNTLPIEIFLNSPVLTKLMFFKWGHYFIGTKEFNYYADWELPRRAIDLQKRLSAVYFYDNTYYIWDDSLIAMLVREIRNLHVMHVITTEEMKEIKNALEEVLDKLEECLNGNYMPTVGIAPNSVFYSCPVHLGFTCNYLTSGNMQSATLATNFSSCMIDDKETFDRLKNWVDSFRNISTLLSQSGRLERRLFFEEQHKVISSMLH